MVSASENYKPVAVITGAARGIGRALVTVLYSKGYNVVALVRNAADVAAFTALDQNSIWPICCDITHSSTEDMLRDFLKKHTEKVDLLVNNAGVDASGQGINGLDYDELDLNLSVHCYGAIRCVRACLPFLKASSRALIVNMSSVYASIELVASGRVAHNQVTHSYKIAQGASNMLAAVLAAELRSDNIRVISFDPGNVKTRLGSAAAKTEPEQVAEAIVDQAEKNFETGVFLHIKRGRVPW